MPDGIVVADFGGGHMGQGDINLDIKFWPGKEGITEKDGHVCRNVICAIGFDPIPLEDNSVDKIRASQFIEHLPGMIWYREDGEWKHHNPRVYMMSEAWRILKPGGEFWANFPTCTSNAMHQDPSHCFPGWCQDTLYYFCGGFPGPAGMLGIDLTKPFELVSYTSNGTIDEFTLRKPLCE